MVALASRPHLSLFGGYAEPESTNQLFGNSKKVVLVVTGVSGAGKDSIADRLFYHHGYTNIKFSGETKRHIEDCLDLPHGALDDRDFRQRRVVNPITGLHEDFTYLDVLIQEYHHRVKSQTPWITLPKTGKRIQKSLCDVVITDMRTPTEAEYLCTLRNTQLTLKHIRVYGRGQALVSDEFLLTNERILPIDYMISNVGSLADLHNAVDLMVHSINKGDF